MRWIWRSFFIVLCIPKLVLKLLFRDLAFLLNIWGQRFLEEARTLLLNRSAVQRFTSEGISFLLSLFFIVTLISETMLVTWCFLPKAWRFPPVVLSEFPPCCFYSVHSASEHHMTPANCTTWGCRHTTQQPCVSYFLVIVRMTIKLQSSWISQLPFECVRLSNLLLVRVSIPSVHFDFLWGIVLKKEKSV